MTARKGYKTYIQPAPAPAKHAQEQYQSFSKINGSHPLKAQVPAMVVEYPAFRRLDGKVFYFNYALAKEMGLISSDHVESMNPQLEERILDTFSLQIINEYDILNQTPVPGHLIKPNRYMATRYLQMQHPNKRGTTSGDGRGIWNGEFQQGSKTWDISSTGTGATQLSPATAKEGKFFKTGDPKVCYGNGRADLDDGVSAALMSEVFHQSGIPTERTLAVISYPNKEAVIVRAAPSLLRPAHFFSLLKRNQLESLQALVDFHYSRQVANNQWPQHKDLKKKLDHMIEQIAEAFGKAAARFENDYVFCWLEWDGDNVLTNGGIIDYGSIRRFGLCHHAYRYDDGDRFSTSLFEQKHKARYIVQTFAQIRDYILTGNKKDIESFKNDPSLKVFSEQFRRTKLNLFIDRLGFSQKQKELLLTKFKNEAQNLLNHVSHFERQLTLKEQHNTPDGINREALFCISSLLRELPQKLSQSNLKPLTTKEFLQLMKTKFLNKKDFRYQEKLQASRVLSFQKEYLHLTQSVATHTSLSSKRLLLEMGMRASLKNRKDRMTGNSAIVIAEAIMKKRRRLKVDGVFELIAGIVRDQAKNQRDEKAKNSDVAKTLKSCFRSILKYFEEI